MLERPNIADLKGSEHGPVALLGNGPSIKAWDLAALSERMPLFGINRSWKLGVPQRYICYVDSVHHFDVMSGAAIPERAAFRLVGNGANEFRWFKPPRCAVVDVKWLARERPGEERFSGASLDRGSYGLFSGYFGLEVVTWLGFNPIYLIGFDGDGMASTKEQPAFDSSSPLSRLEILFWRDSFRAARPALDELGVRVVNCALESAIDAFEKGGLE